MRMRAGRFAELPCCPLPPRLESLTRSLRFGCAPCAAVEGDRKGGIDTFASRFGTAAVARAATALLLLNYVHAIATGILAAPGTFRTWLMLSGHSLAAGWLAWSAKKFNADKVSTAARRCLIHA